MKRFFSLVVLGTFLVGLLGLMTVCDKEKKEPIEFSDSFKFNLRSKAELFRTDKEYKEGLMREQERFVARVLDRIEFLNQCRNTEPLKSFLSEFDEHDIVILREEDMSDTTAASLVLNATGVQVIEHWLNIGSSMRFDVTEAMIYDWRLNGTKVERDVFKKLAFLSNEDILKIIEKEIIK